MVAYVYEKNGRLKLTNIEEPKQKDENIIIKVNACSICGTDLRTYRYGSSKIVPPRIIGHEVCGEIVHVGKNIKGFSVGDRVQVVPAIGCGSCYFCKIGYTNLCDDLKTIGFQYDGCFAEFMEIPPDAIKKGHVNKVNEDVSDEEAALVEPVACVINAHQFINVKEGEVVAIFGAGFIGSINAELSMLRGASKVIIIETNEKRGKAIKKLIPYVLVINPMKVDLVKEIKNLGFNRGVDVAITACSSGQAQVDSQRIISKLGRISIFGGLSGESRGFIDSNIIHYREISVFGVHASNIAQNIDALKLIKERKIDVKKYISNIFSLKKIEEAFNYLNNENALKVIIKPE